MNEFMPTLTTSTPFTTPANTATSKAAATASGTDQPCSTTSQDEVIAEAPITPAIDRSNAPASKGRISPTATSAGIGKEMLRIDFWVSADNHRSGIHSENTMNPAT